MNSTCIYCCDVSSMAFKLGRCVINLALMYTCRRLVKCQFASPSVCFLLLASDNSSLRAEEQYDAGVQAAFLGMVPPFSCAHYTTASHRLRLCQPAQNNTHWCPQPAAHAWHKSPTGTVGKYQVYPGTQSTVIGSHYYPETSRHTHTEH